MRTWAIVTVAALALAVLFAAGQLRAPTMEVTTHTVHIGTTTIPVEVALTPAAREHGLSGRPALAPGTGMLFVFEQDGIWGIWMKDMHFAIDIVWAEAGGKVVTVVAGATPESYPQTFEPTAPVRYVLELPAGFAAEAGIAEGTEIVVQ